MSKRQKKKKRSTAEAAKRRAEQHKAEFEITSLELPEGVSLFRLKSTKAVRLDIIPYEVGEGNPFADKGELHYERTYFVHRQIGAEQSSYVCLRKTFEEKCPICEHRAKLMRDPDADEDLIRDLAPKERQIFNVVDTGDREKGVQLWDISFHLFGKMLDARIRNADEDDGYENFAELEDGSTLKLGVAEKSFGGRTYYEVETIDFKQRKEDYDDDILEDTRNLDEVIKPLPYDELKTIFLQMDDDDDDDDRKKKKSGKSGKSGKKKEEEDDDEGNGDTLEDLGKDDDEADFDDFKGEITKRCGEADLDSDDYDTWKKAELAARKVLKKSKKKSEDADDDLDDDFGDDLDDDFEDEDTVEVEDDDAGEEANLDDLSKDDDEADFDGFEKEIAKRCKKADIDPDDYDTWKEAELAARKALKKSTKKKSSKKGSARKADRSGKTRTR